jgi:hypothetical protein
MFLSDGTGWALPVRQSKTAESKTEQTMPICFNKINKFLAQAGRSQGANGEKNGLLAWEWHTLSTRVSVQARMAVAVRAACSNCRAFSEMSP